MNALDKAQKAYFLANGRFTSDPNNLDLDIENISCGKDDYLAFCASGKFSLNGYFEWHGSTTGQTRYSCYAYKSNEIEKQLCESYYRDWGGTQTGAGDNNMIFYYGAWK